MSDRGAEAHRLVAFLNTLHIADGDDRLADRRARSWLVEWLGDELDGDEPAPEAVEPLRVVREGLRQLVMATGGTPSDGEQVARAGAVLRAVPLVVELGDHERGPGLTGGTGAAGRALARVVSAYLGVRAGDEWRRVKVCAAPDCRWAFLDTSRNRSRRWCDMADCGNRAKNRQWRERRRSA